jgi:hypothetical protein
MNEVLRERGIEIKNERSLICQFYIRYSYKFNTSKSKN